MSEKRSISPARAQSQTQPVDTLMDLRTQITAKDHRIQELENIIGRLESKHPNLQEIIHSRLEMERLVFEEKSEKVSTRQCCILFYSNYLQILIMLLIDTTYIEKEG